MNKLRSISVAGFMSLALAYCGGPSTTPHYMPSNAPQSVKNANDCIDQRSDTSLVIVSGGGKGWWVQQGLGTRTYDWATGEVSYSGGYDVYGWVPQSEATCPNDAFIGGVWDSGW